MAKWPDIQTRFFRAPEAEVIDAATLRSHFVYEVDDNAASQEARTFFEKYLDKLGSRGGTISIFHLHHLKPLFHQANLFARRENKNSAT